jgi:branched-chain amino acid transport system substrate-binding protein
MRKRLLLLLALFAVVGLVMAACGGDDSAAEEPAPAAPADPEPAPADPEPAPADPEPAPAEPAPQECPNPSGTIVIGAAVAHSGFAVTWGIMPSRSALFAMEDINAAGGVLGCQLEFVSADDESDFAANGAAAAAEVIDQGAVAVITNCDFDWSAPAATEATGRGIPTISWCAGAPNFGSAGLSELSFSAGIATPNEGGVGAEFGYHDQGFRTAFLLVDTSLDYNTSYCASYGARFEELGGTVLDRGEFEQTDVQLQGTISRYQNLDVEPDVIAICSYGSGGATAIRQLRAAGVETTIWLNLGFAGDFWVDQIGEPLDNTWMSTYVSWTGDDPRAEINELTARYEEEYGEKQDLSYTFMGYQVIQLLAAAIETAGSTDGTAIADALRSNETVGIVGKHVFDPNYNHSFEFALTVMKVENGEASWYKIQEPDPTYDYTSLVEVAKAG